ncbi:hypothetical protein E9I77_005577, partial [Escherichia coli]
QVAGNRPSDEYHFIGLLMMNVHVRGGIMKNKIFWLRKYEENNGLLSNDSFQKTSGAVTKYYD